LTDHTEPAGDPFEPIDPFDESQPTDPFADFGAGTPLPPLEDPSVPPASPPRSPVLTGVIVALLLVIVTVALFTFLSDDGDTTAAETTAPTETTAPGTNPGTSTPEGTTAPSTVPATTSPAEAPVDFEPYVASGEPVAVADLTLAVDGVGPILFGTPAAESIGRLISSLGEVDDDSGPVVSTGAFGTCTGELERLVRWGPFVGIVVVDPDGTETFTGYRLDLNYGDSDSLSSPAVDLQTLSGLKAGFSVLQLEQIYSSFDIRYEVVDEIGPTFQLYSSNTGNLLLWGPVTSDESTGIVLGIYAPDSCGRF
jgi:hypothetical protein